MSRIILAASVFVVAILVGGGAYLAVFDIPAPTAKVEKVLPDAHFPQ